MDFHVCGRAWSVVLRVQTLSVIFVLIEWFQTKPFRPHWLQKPSIMVSLWVGKVIQGLVD